MTSSFQNRLYAFVLDHQGDVWMWVNVMIGYDFAFLGGWDPFPFEWGYVVCAGKHLHGLSCLCGHLFNMNIIFL